MPYSHHRPPPVAATRSPFPERRSAFRRVLDGRVRWHPAGAASGTQEDSVMAQFHALDAQIQQALAGLAEIPGSVRDVLHLLRRQTRLLASTCEDSPVTAATLWQALSISRTGIAFASAEPCTPGTSIELTVELDQPRFHLRATGTLVRCERRPHDHLMAVSLARLDDALDTQLHALLLQDQRLRRSAPSPLTQPLIADRR